MRSRLEPDDFARWHAAILAPPVRHTRRTGIPSVTRHRAGFAQMKALAEAGDDE